MKDTGKLTAWQLHCMTLEDCLDERSKRELERFEARLKGTRREPADYSGLWDFIYQAFMLTCIVGGISVVMIMIWAMIKGN